MSIQRISSTTAAQEYGKVNSRRSSKQEGSTNSSKGDSVDISQEALLGSRVGKSEDAGRTAKVQQVRQEVEDGTYITDEKLNSALDRAIDETLGGL